MLAVRRGVVLRRIALVPRSARQVPSGPWDETIVLVSRSWRSNGIAVARRPTIAGRAASIAAAVGAETGRALREGATVVLRGLAAFGTLLLGLAVVLRDRSPKFTTTLKAIALAYAAEAKRAWRDEKKAVAEWRQSLRGHPDDVGDDGPLTRAGADEVDARTRDLTRRR